MRRILFVDDEPFVLEALERMLHNMRHEWDMRFASGGAEALRLMAEAPAEVVVSDMRMPDINGAQLLNEIMQLYPKTVRLILSGFADTEMIMQCVNGTHQFLTKPCGGETLRNVIRRSLELDAWLNNNELKTLVSRLGTVPSVPALYFQILKELGSPNATLDKVGATIAQDPGMTAKMLQMVNSAFFGLRQQLTDPTEAVLQLGLETIKSLVLGLHVFSQSETSKNADFSSDKLWHHSLATATTARRIAQMECREKAVVEESFTAGLLHDVGRLVLVANLPDQYQEACDRSKSDGITLVEAERAVFGASHAEVGGYLLGLWGLPISLVEAAVFHHFPGKCQVKVFAPLTAVHVANVLVQESGAVKQPFPPPEIEGNYLREIGVENRLQSWRSTFVNSRFSKSRP
jgi:HD-like signal output (HDOD) protein/CheY-like chemotaxis protein